MASRMARASFSFDCLGLGFASTFEDPLYGRGFAPGIIYKFRNPVSIVTKNYLVTRDLDLLRELAAHHAVMVHLSINSLKIELASRLEPRASSPRRRLAAVGALSQAGVPVGVLVAPVIPALNDHEIPAVLTAANPRKRVIAI